MHDDDELLRALGRSVRRDEEASREAFDERWEALSAGRLPEEEVAALRAEAESSPEGRRAWEAFRPLSPECRAAVLRLRDDPAEPVAKPASVAKAAEVRTEPPAVRRPFRRWQVPAALAAGLLLLLVAWPVDEPPPLASYEIEVRGGTLDRRSPDEPRSQRFVSQNLLDLTLRPKTVIPGEVELALFLAGADGVRRLELPEAAVEVDDVTGAVRVLAEIGRDLEIPAGEWALIVTVARSGRLPSADEVRRERLGEIAADGWQRFEEPIRMDS